MTKKIAKTDKCFQNEVFHQNVTHSFPLKGKDEPILIACQQDFTVKHTLLQCTDFNEI